MVYAVREVAVAIRNQVADIGCVAALCLWLACLRGHAGSQASGMRREAAGLGTCSAFVRWSLPTAQCRACVYHGGDMQANA